MISSMTSPGASPQNAVPSRMLRVEYKNQPYDWFNLDDVGHMVRSEDFAHTLRENINHYFNVPFENQVIFDEDGILFSAVDFARALQQSRPYFRVYDSREMTQDLREQSMQKLRKMAEDLRQVTQALGAAPPVTSMPASPWPTRGDRAPSSLADRVTSTGLGTSQTLPVGDSAYIPQSTVMAQTGNYHGMNSQNAQMPLANGPGKAAFSNSSAAGGFLGTPRTQEPSAFGVRGAPPTQLLGGGPAGWQSSAGQIEIALHKDRRNGLDKFGFANVPTPDGRCLQITMIEQHFLLDSWNRMQPQDRQIRPNDIIVSVNNVTGNYENMREQLQQDDVFMVVKRGAG
eukprot:TRINITY_DN91840_c0_g1_i1.p1 TRINITY_DN91840_c0_g1~~TRINITY_DN91840_c0_g1_i1.p1  ORF type:complete len:343 (+),score=51.29 TRINITY_DN91840_c0_g1_i1:66-1094(+)